ncbi:LuxR C-terminal-related transcriptional regulator [Nocardioides sp. YJ-D4]
MTTQTVVGGSVTWPELEDPAGSSARLSAVVEKAASMATVASLGSLVELAPWLICEAGGLDRAMLSRVTGSVWTPHTLAITKGGDDPVNTVLAESLVGLSIPLSGSLVETEVLRRRQTLLVDRPRPRSHSSSVMGELSHSRSYVVAPIVISDRVSGFLHADSFTAGRPLGEIDRVLLATFAGIFGLQYERCVAADRLRAQSEAAAAALSAAASQLVSTVRPTLRRAEPKAPVPRRATAESVVPTTSGLTSREWGVLRLIATGATNTQIASALVLSESTVKSHVKHILHKLPAANRAEAVFRFKQLEQHGVAS